jgi:hypothetical protein
MAKKRKNSLNNFTSIGVIASAIIVVLYLFPGDITGAIIGAHQSTTYGPLSIIAVMTILVLALLHLFYQKR